ncbi:DUF4190 domain-containing protein [Siphonobacter sp. SORGH_AS_1065]|uniref:DUF4190 domain-containing protein n=1 Tax=Siphonobacter sp. SORGH_AS_1065 TaxID=3041795 RepID=UPI0027882DF6|nr:DUF4190 domain-containing protein [Siphonobacter sp. SORGH_AS_1065]MDQ1085958.1 hypothetical protein [Siphonobacter sp. SORGH_AS_1065]
MKFVLYLFLGALLFTSCRKVTYTPFLKSNASLTSANDPQKYLSVYSDSSALQTSLVSDPSIPGYIDKPPLLSPKELNFPSTPHERNTLVTPKVTKKIKKLQGREDDWENSPKIEPLALLSFWSLIVSSLLTLLTKNLSFSLVGFPLSIVLGIISLIRIKKNPRRYKGKVFALLGIIYPFFMVALSFVLYFAIVKMLQVLFSFS